MDLSVSQDLQDFREQVRSSLRENLTPELVRAGKRATSIFPDFDASMCWQKILNDKGWVAPGWPKEYGGADWSAEEVSIFQEESIAASAPVLYPMGIQMLGPVLMHYGTEQQKSELIPRILSGEDFWCQGYSEPGAGSDLASLQTRAESDGEDYIVNGSKIWTTAAHNANRMFCLVRTDTECKPQRGITFIMIDSDFERVTWYKDAIIYELHIKAFMDGNNDGVGDFEGLLNRLDYLEELGVTAIWLLPFFPSPFRDDGYDIADYYNVNELYGDLKTFRRFLKESISAKIFQTI